MKRSTLIWMLTLATTTLATPAFATTDDHSNRCHGATVLRQNDSLPGDIDRAGDKDSFSIWIPGSSPVNVRLYTEGHIDTLGRLFDSRCREVRRDDDSGHSYNFAMGVQLHPGQYFVSVEHYNRHRAHGSYDVFFELHQSSHACSSHYAPVCGDDGFTYSNQCHLDRTGGHKAYDGACRADHGDVCGDSSQCVPGLQCVFPTLPGGAIPIAGTCERRHSRHEPNNTCHDATRLRSGDHVNATIDYPGDVDVYRFDLPQPRQSCVCVQSPCQCPGDDDIYLDLFQTDGRLPTKPIFRDAWCRPIRAFMLEDHRNGPFWGVIAYMQAHRQALGGTVYVEVRHESSHGTGHYQFESLPLVHRHGRIYLRR